MTIYELLKTEENDYDIWDTEFDDCVTCCYMDEEDIEDEYDVFCYTLMSNMPVCGVSFDKGTVTANWAELIRKNIEIFREFAKDNWVNEYEDEDDFIYAWIRELHLFLAGYASGDIYTLAKEQILDRLDWDV